MQSQALRINLDFHKLIWHFGAAGHKTCIWEAECGMERNQHSSCSFALVSGVDVP